MQDKQTILITGNSSYGVAGALFKIYPNASFVCRTNGYDLNTNKGQQEVVELSLLYDIFINCSALWKFQQTVLLKLVWDAWFKAEKKGHIINIGSTADRTNKGTDRLYNSEKKALKDFSNALGLKGIWGNTGIQTSYVAFGTMSNKAEEHPTRKLIDIDEVAQYIKWVIDCPASLNINELSIDPIQE